jgi:hypothetical protein
MRISETRDFFARTVEFPCDADEVAEAVGDAAIETPYGEHEERIAEVLERCGVEEFRSLDEICDTIIGNVGQSHVGRTGYDDRGANVGAADEDEVSF